MADIAPKDFFAGVRTQVRSSLPSELKRFSLGRGHSRLLKLQYSRPDIHYEAWHHTGDGRLEVGLHFEGTAELNDRAFDYFRSRMVEVKAMLPRAELEPWDRGWSRLYETLRAPRLDEPAQTAVAGLMVRYIEVLQPMVERFLEE